MFFERVLIKKSNRLENICKQIFAKDFVFRRYLEEFPRFTKKTTFFPPGQKGQKIITKQDIQMDNKYIKMMLNTIGY